MGLSVEQHKLETNVTYHVKGSAYICIGDLQNIICCSRRFIFTMEQKNIAKEKYVSGFSR